MNSGSKVLFFNFLLTVVVSHTAAWWTRKPSKDACVGDPCKNGATCSSVRRGFRTTYECSCPSGYFGKTCEMSPCKDVVCRNGGKCSGSLEGWGRKKATFSCNCPREFGGDFCELELCKNQVCQNGGYCEVFQYAWDNTYDFDCNCPSGYFGKNCQINPCSGAQCSHNGTCTAISETDYRCQCPPGKYGKLCDEDPCENVQCLNEGFCTVVNQHVVDCNCKAGFFGAHCEKQAARVAFQQELELEPKRISSTQPLLYNVSFPEEYLFPPQVTSVHVASGDAGIKYRVAVVTVATGDMKVRVLRTTTTDFDGSRLENPTLYAFLYAVSKPKRSCNLRCGRTDGNAVEVTDFGGYDWDCRAHCGRFVGMYNAVHYDEGRCWCVHGATTVIPDYSVYSFTKACLFEDPE